MRGGRGGAPAILASALALGGCTHTREVTPWLRTSRTVPFRLIAESGGAGGYDTVRAWRKEQGRWVELRGEGDGAFAFAGGTRAVIGDKLYREIGPPVPIACRGELRGTPDDRELVCIDVTSRFSREGVPETASVVRIDRDGREIGRRQVPLPVRVPPNEPPLGMDVSTNFLGFLPEGLVFAVFQSNPGESFANDVVKQCRAFLLRDEGRWQELGALAFRVPEFWKCRFPRPWNELYGWQIDRGKTLQDSRGEPDP